MNLVETSIKNPVTVAVGVIFLVIFGLISLFRIPVQLTPDVETLRVTVSTFWRGASPFEMESEIVNEQEDELQGITGLRRLDSESSENSSEVILEFETGADIDSKVVKVSNRLDQVTEYPDDAERPVITTVDPRANAMAWFILKPLPDNPTDINLYYDFADEIIRTRLERVPGVGASNVFGGRERLIEVLFDPAALTKRNITIAELAASIDRENENFSAGSFSEGKRQYLVRTVGEYRTTRDIGNIVVATAQSGLPVYLRDVATVRLGYEDPGYTVRQNGEPSIAINVLRESGANSMEVKEDLFAAVEELNTGVLKENGLHLRNVYEETGYIKNAIKLVRGNLIIGGVLAIAVLLLFLRSASSTMIVAIAIPSSVVGTFIVFEALGRTINVVSLAGMSFAVGMVIDNSIVVLENVYRHMQMGKSRAQAAYDGTTEVWGAVLASTLTTAAVFIPIMFIQEQTGQLFRDIAIAISVSVILSLLVSITVIPSASSKYLSAGGAESLERLRIMSRLLGFAGRVSGFINGFTEQIMTSVRRRVVLVGSFTLLSIVLIIAVFPKTEYLPTGDRNFLFGILIPPPGYNVEEYTAIGKQIEADLEPYINERTSAERDLPRIKNFFYVARGKQIVMGAIAEKRKEVKELFPVLQQTLSEVPGTFGVIVQPSIFNSNIGEGRSIDVNVTGDDLDEILRTARSVFFMSMEAIPGAQVRPIPSLDLGSPEVRIVTEREAASRVGITNSELGFTVRSLIDGVEASEFNLEGQEVDIVLRAEQDFSERTQDIENIMITSPSGQVVTVGAVAQVSLENGPEQINHYERQRVITIQITPPEEVTLEEGIETINDDIISVLRESGQVGERTGFVLSGTADKLATAKEALQLNFLLAVVISFLLMAALFGSFLHPLVILVTVPFASLGGFIGLFILNLFTYQPLDILTMLGFVILIGIVINNAILIVHQALNNMRAGMEEQAAISESVRVRIRPIFMSTLTSVFGMLPLVLAPGEGSELYKGLGSVVVGGLVLSTAFTLFLIPSVFSLMLEFRKRFSVL
jgi:HAE1 family hydrophobic/amphiphilic exporter-1